MKQFAHRSSGKRPKKLDQVYSQEFCASKKRTDTDKFIMIIAHYKTDWMQLRLNLGKDVKSFLSFL